MVIDWIENSINTLFAVMPRCRPKAALWRQVKVIAHRGAHCHRNQIWENTQPAFERAKAMGCWGIELDVQTTADGVLVVHHDATLQRLWGRSEAIACLTYLALRRLAPEVPTLEEVVQRYGKTLHLFIELKAPFTQESTLCEILASLTPVQDYHLLSLETSLFERMALFPREALLLVPLHNNAALFCDVSIAKRYGGVLGHYLLLTSQRVKRLRHSGQQVGVGFVDSKFSLYREVNRGIKWIFTNRVENIIDWC
jgi:glycerophosphoryl diester phosphodiesterase